MIQRMLNAHPAMNFEETYEYARVLWKKTRESHRQLVFSSRRELLVTMGRSYKSGTSHAIAASLVHFGFLERTENDAYSFSFQAQELLSLKKDSKHWSPLARALAIKPELYKYLYSKYAADLPENITHQLIDRYGDRNITTDTVKGIVKDYLDSLHFAGYTAAHKKNPAHMPLGNLGEVQEVSLNGETVLISKKHLLEAYEKTLEDHLMRVRNTLQHWNQ